jgi:2-methylisocitrate lyase-like PEP mutase family enzyme
MTNEQLNHYEGLCKLVDHEHEELTDKVAQLAGMSMQDDETSSRYCTRVQDKIDEIRSQRRRVEAAKQAKREFVMRECVNA